MSSSFVTNEKNHTVYGMGAGKRIYNGCDELSCAIVNTIVNLSVRLFVNPLSLIPLPSSFSLILVRLNPIRWGLFSWLEGR